jgi:predicted metalloprotease with PDZ domain
LCSDAPAHPGLKSADTAVQHGYGDEPGDSGANPRGHRDQTSDTTPSDGLPRTAATANDITVRNHLRARSAVLDTLGQSQDSPMAEGGDTQTLGITVRPLTASERQLLGVDGGLMVTGVSAGTGLKAGFQPGDVVLSLDGVAVTTPDQFYKLAQKLPHDRPVPVLVHRPTSTIFLPLEAPARR